MSSLSLPSDEQPGQPNNVNAVMANDEAIRDKINGALDADNLTPAEAVKLGLTAGATVRRGKSIIATEEARTNVAYGLLTTADRVSGIVMPADGLMCVAYQALMKSSSIGAGFGAIFLNANQVMARQASNFGQPAPGASGTEAVGKADANEYEGVSSQPLGLCTNGDFGGVNATSDVTTGQSIGINPSGTLTPRNTGGPCYIFAAAGTYDISVQWRAATGTVTVKERKLWVWTMGF